MDPGPERGTDDSRADSPRGVSGDLEPAAPAAQRAHVREVPIRGDSIRLGQLLKLADVIGSGAEGKSFLADGEVTVNGDPETRRGRRLTFGDVVSAPGCALRVVGSMGENG